MKRTVGFYDFCVAAAWDAQRGHLPAIAMEAAKPSRRESGSAEGDSAGPKDIAQRTNP
jgi:hypothetical protein